MEWEVRAQATWSASPWIGVLGHPVPHRAALGFPVGGLEVIAPPFQGFLEMAHVGCYSGLMSQAKK